MNKYKLTVSGYNLIRDVIGIPVYVDCECHIDGIYNSDQSHRVYMDKLYDHITDVTDYKSFDEYWQEEESANKEIDLAMVLNKKQNRTESFKVQDDLPDFFNALANILNPML